MVIKAVPQVGIITHAYAINGRNGISIEDVILIGIDAIVPIREIECLNTQLCNEWQASGMIIELLRNHAT